MVKKVNSIEEAIAHVLKSIANNDHNNTNLKEVTADTMQEVIEPNVYDAYTPKKYERRGAEGGFLDKSNMVFTDVQTNGNSVNLTFENITTGNDSMSGERIDDLFENGNGTWENSNGRWVNKRPFLDDTVEALNNNKGELTNAVKKDLKNIGFDVK